MELSETTLAYLRDEAYAHLARQALLANLKRLEQERDSVASTRPPFGVLGRRESREAYARSMRSVNDNEAVVCDQLVQITGITDWLRPFIRRDVSTYLAAESPDYCRLLQIAARVDDWERAYRLIPELLVAFARDLRAVRLALVPEKKSHPLISHEITVLRESAEGLAAHRHELRVIEQAALALAPADLADQLKFPALPDLQRLPWVSRLAVVPPETALPEVTQAEAEIRLLLASPMTQVVAQLQEDRDRCTERADRMLEEYWNQLRLHARAHYVEERDVQDVIRMLNERYIDADLQRRQQALSVHPFSAR